jgi:hypothetical protein
MADQDDHGGRAGRSWWVDALDPVENLRALVNAQGFGRRAAEELADRLLAESNGHGSGTGDGDTGDGDTGDDVDEIIRRLGADAVRAGELSVSVINHLTTLLAAVARGRNASTRPDREPAAVVLPDVAPGAETNGLFWIHNTSAVPVAAVRPHSPPLRSHLGDELPAGAVRFDPAVLDPLPARSSCGIDVRVSVPATTRAGVYVSIILVENVAEMHLPLRITVRAEETTP